MSTPTCSLPTCGKAAVWRLTIDVGEPTELALHACRLHGQRLRETQAAHPDVAVEVPGLGAVNVFGPHDRITLIDEANPS